jgi:hypothetical protein
MKLLAFGVTGSAGVEMEWKNLAGNFQALGNCTPQLLDQQEIDLRTRTQVDYLHRRPPCHF